MGSLGERCGGGGVVAAGVWRGLGIFWKGSGAGFFVKVFKVFLDGFNCVCGADPLGRDVLVILQRQVPADAFIGRAWTFLLCNRDAFHSHTVRKTVEIPQVQFLEVVERPLLCCDWCCGPDNAKNCLEVRWSTFL